MAWRSRSVPPVWIAAAVGAVIVGWFAGAAYLTWMPIVLAVTVLLAFVIQLALQRKDGLVARLAASATGALVILAVASGVIALIRLS
jgi:hypothetical protein